MNQEIEIYIDELVLHGYSLSDRYDISEALQNELSRLIIAQGLPISFLRNVNIPSIKNVSFQQSRNMNSEMVGGQIAESLYESFNNIKNVSAKPATNLKS